jgi:hypothetical protein
MAESVYCNSNLLTQVSSLVFDDNGILYASNFGNGAGIIKIDINGNGTLLTDLGSSNNYISCLVYYNNYLYVSVFANTGKFYKVDINNGTYSVLTTITGTNVCGAGMIYYQNFLYAVVFHQPGFYGVFKISITDGSYINFITPSTYNFTTYGGSYIAIDSNGNFYVTNYGNVVKFNNNGNLLSSNFIIYNSTGGLKNILFYENNFYFTNNTVNEISKYDINGTLITNNYSNGGSTYQGGGMAFDINGNFYVSNEINGGGAGNVTILKKLTSTSYITFNPNTNTYEDLIDVFKSGNSLVITGFKLENGNDLGTIFQALTVNQIPFDTKYITNNNVDITNLFESFS